MAGPRPRPSTRKPGGRQRGDVDNRRPPRSQRRQPSAGSGREDLVYGRNPVLEAARAGRVRRLLIAGGPGRPVDARIDEIVRVAMAGGADASTRSKAPPIEHVEPADLDRMAPGAVHQGVIAEVAPRQYVDLKQLLATEPSLLVALDSILDPQNLGAILRTAEAAGADAAILPERRSAPISAVAAKASAGATEYLTICRVPGLPAAISDMKRAGIWCIALDPHGELLPWEFDFSQPTCVVVGGEGSGLHRLVKERADGRVRLPMAGRMASLNASAAAAALLYEVARQRSVIQPR